MSRLAATALILLAATAAMTRDAAIRKELHAAATAGDLSRFDTALDDARTFIETMKVGNKRNAFRRVIVTAEDLSRVWHFAAGDPRGMFYDDERLPFFYDRIAGDFPDYPKFIEGYRVADKDGLLQYPTRETRNFLIRKLQTSASHSP